MWKKLFIYLLLLVIIFFSYNALASFSDSPAELASFDSLEKTVTLIDHGIAFPAKTQASTVAALLKEKGLTLSDYDEVTPSQSIRLLPGAQIEIRRATRIKIEVDDKTLETYTFARTIRDALTDQRITLSRLDKTSPALPAPCQPDQTIVVTRINEEEKVIPEAIDYKTITKTDNKLGWREKKIETPGEKGIKEVTYKITYKNGKEMSRVVLDKKTTKDPVSEVVVQGTYVKIGKSHRGQGTWYSFKGGLYAASPWLPMGSFAKVTNTATGKTVIVEINDRGPFGDGRIIDLDKLAFQKIASLGSGVIDVKVEEILN